MLPTGDVCAFCLDLDEMFLFTQEVTGQEVSVEGFRLKSLKISEGGNRRHRSVHMIMIASSLWRKHKQPEERLCDLGWDTSGRAGQERI